MYGCTDAEYDAVLALLDSDAATAQQLCADGSVASFGGPGGAVTHWTVGQLRAAQSALEQVEHGLDTSFVLTSAYQVFMMQLGFALFAAGVVRPKNTVAIFLKNLFDTCIAGIAFYVLGYAFAFGSRDGNPAGGNGFIGNWDFALSWTDGGRSRPDPYSWHLWVWNWSFCSAATTILSGSIAERATFSSYMIYAAFMPAWVYPVAAHWLWADDGWLSARNVRDRILGVGAIDYAGSGVVHLVGGMAALIGSVAVGPRVGRFGPDASGQVPAQLTRAASAPHLYVMGTMVLWFGWYGFNPGSRLEISTYSAATAVARTAVTTTLAACAGALTNLVFNYYRRRVWDLLATCLGALSGLVAVTAGCSVMEPWAAIICGIIAAFWYEAGEALLERFKIDDPVSAFPLHAMCGAWGLIYTGLMAQEGYVEQVYGIAPGHHRMGLFYGGHAQLLLCQVIAVLVVAGWSAANMALLFFGMKAAGILRVGADKEAAGMDLAACGQFNAQGAVNIHSSKVVTKNDMLLSAVSFEQHRHRLSGTGTGTGTGYHAAAGLGSGHSVLTQASGSSNNLTAAPAGSAAAVSVGGLGAATSTSAAAAAGAHSRSGPLDPSPLGPLGPSATGGAAATSVGSISGPVPGGPLTPGSVAGSPPGDGFYAPGPPLKDRPSPQITLVLEQ